MRQTTEALCFFLSSGPRCAASWPLLIRRSLYWQWHVQGCYFWYFTLHAVFPVAVHPDALHHGRYGPDVLGHGCSHARCVQRHMPVVQTAETVDSPQLQSIQVVDTSFAAQRQSLMVQTVRQTIDILQLLYKDVLFRPPGSFLRASGSA